MLRHLAILVLSTGLAGASEKTLQMYFVDVEGGQATLLVTPAGQSLLIDTGWPGQGGRDADRIVAMAKQASVAKIDYLLITHFHMDHVGGVPQLADRIPIGTVIDHGSSVEHDPEAEALFRSYTEVRSKAKHMEPHPGDVLPLKDIRVQVLTAGGNEITQPLPGAGQTNSLCGSEKPREVDPSENAQSIGTLITFGRFRAIDLGDLTWNKELELMCPMNRVGKVDLYVVSHHGMNLSGSATLVHALAPKVAVMDNGARKGGTAEAYRVVRSSPGLEDIWQLHRAVAGGDADNAPEKFVANEAENPDQGFGIKATVRADGNYSVENLRNGFTKQYTAR